MITAGIDLAAQPERTAVARIKWTAVTSHHAGHVSIPADGHGSRRNLTMRRTDVFVHEQLRLTPLSVSADYAPVT